MTMDLSTLTQTERQQYEAMVTTSRINMMEHHLRRFNPFDDIHHSTGHYAVEVSRIVYGMVEVAKRFNTPQEMADNFMAELGHDNTETFGPLE